MLLMQANQKILGHLVELERKGKSVDMIMVGPVSEEPLKVSSKWLHGGGKSADVITVQFQLRFSAFVLFAISTNINFLNKYSKATYTVAKHIFLVW